MRRRVGDGFWLAYDCWMSLTVDYATRLAHAGAEYGLKWIEEPLRPDDYWGLAELRHRLPPTVLPASGETRSDPVRLPVAGRTRLRHRATRRGMVRRPDRTAAHCRARRSPRKAGRPARVQRVLVPLRHSAGPTR